MRASRFLPLLLGLAVPGLVWAQAPVQPAIASMPLGQALNLLVRHSGLQIVYPSRLVRDVRSPGAAAGLAPDAQLQQLLHGTHLHARHLQGGVITIEAGAPTATHAHAPATSDHGPHGPRDLNPISVQANVVDTLAPSAAPLEAMQPTSVIDGRFIRDGLRLNSNFDDIIKYAPSISVTSPEGPGLGKNEGISIRGFQDGQFNITFDGIPFGDATDLHHTTSAYFNNHVLGQAEIDRGPGGGSTIGNATFGGTVALRSRNPSPVAGVTPYLTVGSWNTRAGGVSADTALGAHTHMFADISKEASDTYLKGTDDRREHAFIKTVSQFDDGTRLTFLSSYNREHQNTVQGSSKEEMAVYGRRYGLTSDPRLQSYKGYNNAAYYSSFTYLGLSTHADGWDIDDKLYYNSFSHWSRKTSDASDNDPHDNGVSLYDASGNKVGKLADDVPGKRTHAGFHAFGNVLRLGHDLGEGTVLAGAWLERSLDRRHQRPMDMSTGLATGSKYGTLDTYAFGDRTDTVQPYLQYDWYASDSITVSPGLRYSKVTRTLDASLNKASNAPLNAQASYHATLPSLSVHDRLNDHWSAYAQAAEGFLAPPIDVIETNAGHSLKPEKTRNLQLGTAYAARELTLGADVYYIDFSNFISETEVATEQGNEDAYVNGGGAIYKGAELETTVALSRTLSVYGNASYNQATYKHSHTQIAGTPKLTGTLGLLYNGRSGLYGSLMGKFVGHQYGVDNTTDDQGRTVFANSQRLPGYMAVDAAVGYRSAHGGPAHKGWSLSLDINNLFDVHKLIGYAGTQKVSDDPLYFGLPGRGFFVDLTMKL